MTGISCQYMDHEGIRRLVGDLNRLYRSEPVLGANDFNPRGFRWINCTDAEANVLAYLRLDDSEKVLFLAVGHFGGATRSYRVGVPRRGRWQELINTNSEHYGGSGLGNDGGRDSRDEPKDGYTQSIDITLPPLTTVIFKWSQGSQVVYRA